MALTLGQLRAFCAEIASPDSAGDSADREFMVWINAALIRCYTELHWDRIQFEKKITVVPPVDGGATLNVTIGSRAIVLSAGSIAQAYLDDRWELQIDAENRWTFELYSIDDSPTNRNATLIEGDEWVAATATGLQHSWVKTRYTLPDNAQRVSRVQVLDNQQDVIVLANPAEFDRARLEAPTQSGNQPRFCTFRRGKLELWPHPGTYTKLSVTYIKGPTVLEDDALDAAVIDWDDSWRDLLQKAIQLEAAITQGENAPVVYPIARAEWEDRKATYHQKSTQPDLTGPMSLSMPVEMRQNLDRSTRFLGPLTDV